MEETDNLQAPQNNGDQPNNIQNTRSPISSKLKTIIMISIAIILIIIGIRLISTWYLSHNKKTKMSPVGVLSSVIQNKDMPVYVTALGNVSSYYNITVKTQINGQLLRVFFTEGQAVKKGDVLAEIDPRPYEAQLLQFQGQLARDQAILDNALIDLKRYETLYKEDSVSQQTLETQRALVRQYQGIIQLDQGQIDQVKINLIYCRITSPVDGRVGLRLVDPGNYVQVSDPNGIVVLNTVQPISVLFAIAEDFLPSVLQKIRNGEILTAEAYDRTQNKLLCLGAVSTVDNQIDSSTGTVKLRGIFQNENNVLFPNQFVNIKLLVNILKNSMVVPVAAVQQGNKGSFVYLLKKEESTNQNQIYRVLIKPVKVLATEGNESSIDGDLLPGQSVVIEGNDKLIDNSLVYLINEKKPKKETTSKMNAVSSVSQENHSVGIQQTDKNPIQAIYPLHRVQPMQKIDIQASKYFLLQLDNKFCSPDILLRKNIITRKTMND